MITNWAFSDAYRFHSSHQTGTEIRVIIAYDVHLHLGLIYIAEVLPDKIFLYARQDLTTYNCYFFYQTFQPIIITVIWLIHLHIIYSVWNTLSLFHTK